MSTSDPGFKFHILAGFFSCKRIFFILAITGMIVLPILSLDAGVSGDEEVHYLHSEKVMKYYRTFGKDTAALDTPESHLKYYGQSFDNITTLLIRLFKIDDVYRFRHLANALIGWFAIVMSGFVAISLSGYRAGVFVLILFYLSPRFIGHSFNNLKDIPFALGYILAIYFIFKVIAYLPKPRFRYILFLILGIGFTIGIRIGGIVLIMYLLVFTGLFLISYYLKDSKRITMNIVSRSMLIVLLISLGGYLMGLVFWPFALENPVRNPLTAYRVMSSFPTTLRQIFEGKVYWSDHFPWYYLPKYMLITIPTLVWTGVLLFLVLIKGILKSRRWLFILFLMITFVFPIFFVIYRGANIYGAWRHLTFVFPSLVILSGMGYDYLLERYRSVFVSAGVAGLFMILAFHPLRHMIRNHPYQYLYFNEWVGGISGAYGNYETDYYFHSMREASEWLINHLSEEESKEDEKYIVASNFPVSWFFRNDRQRIDVIYVPYYERGNKEWDYSIFGNSYINPFQLKNGIWPPVNTLHKIQVDKVPICAVLKRTSNYDIDGLRYLNEGEYVRALSSFKRALMSDPANESVYINLARTYLKTGEPDSARIVLSRLDQIYPDYDVAMDLLAEIYLTKRDIPKARAILMENLKVNSKYYPSFYKLAEICLDEGNDQLGLRYLRKCVQLNPDYKKALMRLGKYYKEQGNHDEAQKFFKRATGN